MANNFADILDLDSNRFCLNCRNSAFCHVWLSLNGAVKQTGIINRERNNETPATFADVYTVVANACTKFQSWEDSANGNAN